MVFLSHSSLRSRSTGTTRNEQRTKKEPKIPRSGDNSSPIVAIEGKSEIASDDNKEFSVTIVEVGNPHCFFYSLHVFSSHISNIFVFFNFSRPCWQILKTKIPSTLRLFRQLCQSHQFLEYPLDSHPKDSPGQLKDFGE
jgi:hypothetical protein